jgi:hypothetical protein
VADKDSAPGKLANRDRCQGIEQLGHALADAQPAEENQPRLGLVVTRSRIPLWSGHGIV